MTAFATRSFGILGLNALALAFLAGCRADPEPRLQAIETDVAALGQKIEMLAAQIEAQRLAPDDIVFIEMQGVGPNTRIAIVDPPRKRSCRPASTDCGGEVRWILSGHLPASWKVEVREKSDGSPTGCFESFELDQSNRVHAATPAPGCQKTGVTWWYDVILRDQNGAVRQQIDPLIVMTWAP